jgi:hypothetical protein
MLKPLLWGDNCAPQALVRSRIFPHSPNGRELEPVEVLDAWLAAAGII